MNALTKMTATSVATDAACPKCAATFSPRRKDQRYCSKPCAKAATRNAARGPRTVDFSPELRRRSRMHYDKAMRLAEMVYTMPPNKRLGFMADLIRLAREGERTLRNILTDPTLLRASPDDEGLFFRRSPASYRTISQTADAYCRKFWGAGVKAVVTGECLEPPTGEDGDTDGHAPTPADPKAKAPPCPESWDFKEALRPICKGFIWLTVSRTETRRLMALGGCPGKSPSAYVIVHHQGD